MSVVEHPDRLKAAATAVHDFAPDFFVVGAPKAGTTAVYTWLQQHPDVFLPDLKEPGYFAYKGRAAEPASGPFDPDYHARIATQADAYARLYDGAADRLSGDVSPVYLVDPAAAARIAAARPEARIIILLRDPVDRAFSQFLHHMRDGLEPAPSFEDALDAEAARLRAGWSWGHGYATHGQYATQVKRYLDLFAREQILFLEFAQLNSDPQGCWGRICAHLGLSQTAIDTHVRVNATATLAQVSDRPGVTRALRHPGPLQRLLKPLVPQGLRRWMRRRLEGSGKPLPVLQDSTRQRLAAQFENERADVAAQTGLSLDHWTRTR